MFGLPDIDPAVRRSATSSQLHFIDDGTFDGIVGFESEIPLRGGIPFCSGVDVPSIAVSPFRKI